MISISKKDDTGRDSGFTIPIFRGPVLLVRQIFNAKVNRKTINETFSTSCRSKPVWPTIPASVSAKENDPTIPEPRHKPEEWREPEREQYAVSRVFRNPAHHGKKGNIVGNTRMKMFRNY